MEDSPSSAIYRNVHCRTKDEERTRGFPKAGPYSTTWDTCKQVLRHPNAAKKSTRQSFTRGSCPGLSMALTATAKSSELAASSRIGTIPFWITLVEPYPGTTLVLTMASLSSCRPSWPTRAKNSIASQAALCRIDILSSLLSIVSILLLSIFVFLMINFARILQVFELYFGRRGLGSWSCFTMNNCFPRQKEWIHSFYKGSAWKGK